MSDAIEVDQSEIQVTDLRICTMDLDGASNSCVCHGGGEGCECQQRFRTQMSEITPQIDPTNWKIVENRISINQRKCSGVFPWKYLIIPHTLIETLLV